MYPSLLLAEIVQLFFAFQMAKVNAFTFVIYLTNSLENIYHADRENILVHLKRNIRLNWVWKVNESWNWNKTLAVLIGYSLLSKCPSQPPPKSWSDLCRKVFHRRELVASKRQNFHLCKALTSRKSNHGLSIASTTWIW